MPGLAPRQRAALLLGVMTALLAIAVPTLGADPSPPAEPPGQTKQNQADKGPQVQGSVSGIVEQSTDEKGRPTFSITADGTTWELSAGPKWFWGENNPLAAHVGATVEVTGTYREGDSKRELDVETVNGVVLRSEGKPPWAGGPKMQGEKHPGWKNRDDGTPGKGHGREGAPGQLKEKREDAGGG